MLFSDWIVYSTYVTGPRHGVVIGLVFLLVLPNVGVSASSRTDVKNDAYFVSPSGSDSNPGTESFPFLTLEHARDAMRSSSIKATRLLPGTFMRTDVLKLGHEDSGEVWSATPGHKALIDGSGKADAAIAINSDHITVSEIAISHFLKYGLVISSSAYITIENNWISDVQCSGWNQGGIVLFDNISHVNINHNAIQDVNYSGIFYADSSKSNLLDLRIEFNTLNRTCISVKDCGAIYADDRSHSASQVLIANNTVGDHGPNSNQTKGIYLDDLLSNVVVRNNVVFGTGTYAFQIHGGDHNTIVGNVADITEMQGLGLYQWIGDAKRDFAMRGNTFTCNVVYSRGIFPERLWKSGLAPTDEILTIHDNIYWGDNQKITASVTGDASPHFIDPRFIDPDAKNFHSRADLKLFGCGAIGNQ